MRSLQTAAVAVLQESPKTGAVLQTGAGEAGSLEGSRAAHQEIHHKGQEEAQETQETEQAELQDIQAGGLRGRMAELQGIPQEGTEVLETAGAHLGTGEEPPGTGGEPRGIGEEPPGTVGTGGELQGTEAEPPGTVEELLETGEELLGTVGELLGTGGELLETGEEPPETQAGQEMPKIHQRWEVESLAEEHLETLLGIQAAELPGNLAVVAEEWN